MDSVPRLDASDAPVPHMSHNNSHQHENQSHNSGNSYGTSGNGPAVTEPDSDSESPEAEPKPNWVVDALAGCAAGLISDTVFYGIDSYKILLQSAATATVPEAAAAGATTAAATATAATAASGGLLAVLRARVLPLFAGAVPVIATGSGIVLGTFFAIYTGSKPALTRWLDQSKYSPFNIANGNGSKIANRSTSSDTNNNNNNNSNNNADTTATVTANANATAASASASAVSPSQSIREARIETTAAAMASVLAGVPSSLLGVPSDVVKKHIILSQAGHAAAADGAPVHAQSQAAAAAASSAASTHATVAVSKVKPPPSAGVAAIRTIYSHGGVKGFFTGYQANLMKDVPLSVCKMVFFEGMAQFLTFSRQFSYYPSFLYNKNKSSNHNNNNNKNGNSSGNNTSKTAAFASETAAKKAGTVAASAARSQDAAGAGTTTSDSDIMGRPHLTSAETVLAGVLSGVLTVATTMPLDTINTRMKAPDAPAAVARSMKAAMKDITATKGLAGLWQGTAPRMVTFGLGAGVFWACFAELQKGVRGLGIN